MVAQELLRISIFVLLSSVAAGRIYFYRFLKWLLHQGPSPLRVYLLLLKPSHGLWRLFTGNVFVAFGAGGTARGEVLIDPRGRGRAGARPAFVVFSGRYRRRLLTAWQALTLGGLRQWAFCAHLLLSAFARFRLLSVMVMGYAAFALFATHDTTLHYGCFSIFICELLSIL